MNESFKVRFWIRIQGFRHLEKSAQQREISFIQHLFSGRRNESPDEIAVDIHRCRFPTETAIPVVLVCVAVKNTLSPAVENPEFGQPEITPGDRADPVVLAVVVWCKGVR